MDSKAVLEAMRRGDGIQRKYLEDTIASLERIKEEAEARGMTKMVERIDQTIEEVRAYKSKKRKPRTHAEIQADIDAAQQLIMLYRNSRKYELAAQWERKRDEYLQEWDRAALGRAAKEANGRSAVCIETELQ